MAKTGVSGDERAAGEAPAGRKAAAGRKPATVTAATPWGPATVVEEIRVTQRVGDKQFASLVQLLEGKRGEPFIRFAYTTDGVSRRGPVTLRPKDIERLRATLDPSSPLAAALGWSGGDA
jgi:hypothetical protein